MLTLAIDDYLNDAKEDRVANTVDVGYNSESIYDHIDIAHYTGVSIDYVGLFKFDSVTVSAAVTSATLYLYAVRLAGNGTNTYSLYGDIGSGRQDAWGVSSRYETGFTATTDFGTLLRSGMTLNAFNSIDITDVVNDIIANASGGWASGQSMRFALVPNVDVSGDTMRIAGMWHTATPDNDHAAYIEIVAGGGGGGGISIPVVYHHRRMMGAA